MIYIYIILYIYYWFRFQLGEPLKIGPTCFQKSWRVCRTVPIFGAPGIYPDEWHWREGISKPEKFREIVNAWPLGELPP